MKSLQQITEAFELLHWMFEKDVLPPDAKLFLASAVCALGWVVGYAPAEVALNEKLLEIRSLMNEQRPRVQ